MEKMLSKFIKSAYEWFYCIVFHFESNYVCFWTLNDPKIITSKMQCYAVKASTNSMSQQDFTLCLHVDAFTWMTEDCMDATGKNIVVALTPKTTTVTATVSAIATTTTTTTACM